MNRVSVLWKHILIVGALLVFLIGVPLLRTDAVHRMRGDDVDTVSGATRILDAPSGAYVILINEALHTDSGTLAAWCDFFAGEDAGVIFEDIDCIVIRGDSAGMEAAMSSRLTGRGTPSP